MSTHFPASSHSTTTSTPTPCCPVPLLPDALLRRHHVHEPLDPRFRAAARLLQALWRPDRGLPLGHHVAGTARRKLGSRLSTGAARAGADFLIPGVRDLVRRELAYREPGALIDEERLTSNLPSSMPLAFNLHCRPSGPAHQLEEDYDRD